MKARLGVQLPRLPLGNRADATMPVEEGQSSKANQREEEKAMGHPSILFTKKGEKESPPLADHISNFSNVLTTLR